MDLRGIQCERGLHRIGKGHFVPAIRAKGIGSLPLQLKGKDSTWRQVGNNRALVLKHARGKREIIAAGQEFLIEHKEVPLAVSIPLKRDG